MGASFRHDCPHCRTEAVSFDARVLLPLGGIHGDVLARCGICYLPIAMRVATRTGMTASQNLLQGNLADSFHVQRVWPESEQLASPKHVPERVSRRFLEAEDNFARGNWTSAVSMYRSVLDIATKTLDGVPEGQTFFKRLRWLHEHHRITPAMKDWADHVRVEGNDALHDPEEFTEVDATPLRLFTEMFLRYMFELPGEVDSFRAVTPGDV